MNDLVSVVIPTYKRPDFLSRAIESVLAQTYPNIELIVVSDNDIGNKYDRETSALMKHYMDNKKVIYLAAEGNKGGCHARNRGLAYAHGQYINFLDDDDLILPRKIELQMQLAKKNPDLAVIGCCASIRNAKGEIYRVERPKFDRENILFSELKCNLCTTSINLINTEVCCKAGGFHYIESSQEHLFLISIFDVCPTFDYVDEVLTEINQHAGVRVSNNKKRPLGVLKLTKYIETFYPRFTPEQIQELQLARYKADILAYADLGEFKKARSLFWERIKLAFFDIDNAKIMVRLCQKYSNRAKK